MPIELVTSFLAYDLPSEGVPAHVAFLAQLDSAKTTIHGRIFGFTDPTVRAALTRAMKRGVTVQLIVDHSQSTDHTTAALLHGLLLDGFPVNNLCLTNSPLGQYMHKKVWLIDGAAEMPADRYYTVAEATAAGYPRVICGSTNASITAYRQDNDLFIIPGSVYARQCIASFDTEFAWGRAHESHYQLSA